MHTTLENNMVAYELLYKIEVGLREFLIDRFGRTDQKWWKTRLPPDVLDKLKNGREKERKIKWVELLPHHPLYYIDFPDLKKLLRSRITGMMLFKQYLVIRMCFVQVCENWNL